MSCDRVEIRSFFLWLQGLALLASLRLLHSKVAPFHFCHLNCHPCFSYYDQNKTNRDPVLAWLLSELWATLSLELFLWNWMTEVALSFILLSLSAWFDQVWFTLLQEFKDEKEMCFLDSASKWGDIKFISITISLWLHPESFSMPMLLRTEFFLAGIDVVFGAYGFSA